MTNAELTDRPPSARALLSHRTCDPGERRVARANETDRVMLILPLTRTRLTLHRGRQTVYDGTTQPGMVRVTQPGEEGTVDVGNAYQAAAIALPVALSSAIADVGTDGSVLAARPELRALLPSLIWALRLEGERRDVVADGLAMAMVGVLLPAATSAAPLARLSERELRLAVEFAVSRFATGIDLASWASVLDMPTREFSQRFRNSTGTTPYAWFLARRMDEAMHLLSTTRLPVSEIAEQLGFSSQSHLTDAFRDHVGAPPGRWRRDASR